MTHWFVLYERILLMRMTWYTLEYCCEDDFMSERIVNEDDFVHWFVLYERILLMRMTWHAGFYFMNKYC